jgi:hypothetical protein
MMTEDVRRRLGELATIAAALDGLLADPGADRLPGLRLARLAVAVDQAAAELARHLEALGGTTGRENFPP